VLFREEPSVPGTISPRWGRRIRTCIGSFKGCRPAWLDESPLRAPNRLRTDDLRITGALLYQLSYRGLVSSTGFEPARPTVSGWCLLPLGYEDMEPLAGLTRRPSLYESDALPLSYRGTASGAGFEPTFTRTRTSRPSVRRPGIEVGEKGFEPSARGF
jgi:hypothetical protein